MTTLRTLRAASLATLALASLVSPGALATHEHDPLSRFLPSDFETNLDDRIPDGSADAALTTFADANVAFSTYPDRCTVYVTATVSGFSPAHEYDWFAGMVEPVDRSASRSDERGPIDGSGTYTFTYVFSVARGVTIVVEAWIQNRGLGLDGAYDRAEKTC